MHLAENIATVVTMITQQPTKQLSNQPTKEGRKGRKEERKKLYSFSYTYICRDTSVGPIV
jgi:hypothetical protein